MRKKILLISFVLTLLVLTILPMNVTAEAGRVKLADWDNIATGLNDGNDEYIDFESNGTTDYFMTSNTPGGVFSGDNSFMIKGKDNVPVEVGNGYWNLTYNFTYIGQLDFWFKLDDNAVLINDFFYMDFYDSDDNKVIALRWDLADNDIDWFDIVGGWSTLYASVTDNAWFFFQFNHTGTNNFEANIYDANNILKGTHNYAGMTTDTWDNFEYIHLYTDTWSDDKEAMLYIDEINITTTGSGASEEGGFDEFPGLMLDKPSCGVIGSMYAMKYYEWFGNVRDTRFDTHHWFYTSEEAKYLEFFQDKTRTTTIYYVDIFVDDHQKTLISSNAADYDCRVNNNPFTFVGFIPKTIDGKSGQLIRFAGSAVLTNDYPLICFKCSATIDTSGYGNDIHWYPMVMGQTCNWGCDKHNIPGDFIDNQLDGVQFNNPSAEFEGWYFVNGYVSPYIQYWYSGGDESTGTKKPVSVVEQDNLTLEYGDSFIEFYHHDYCDYGIGSKPTLVYHLNNTQCNLYNKYYFEIINKANEEVAMNGFIDFTVGTSEVFDTMELQKSFYEIGQYYISLWNLTNNVQKDSLVMLSQDTVIVCTKGKVGLDSGNKVNLDNTGGNSFGFVIATLPMYAKVLISLVIILTLTLTPLAFSMLLNKTNVKVDIPALLYVAFFFLGIVSCILLGVLDYWVLFVVLFGIIVTFAVLWIQDKGFSGGEG